MATIYNEFERRVREIVFSLGGGRVTEVELSERSFTDLLDVTVSASQWSEHLTEQALLEALHDQLPVGMGPIRLRLVMPDPPLTLNEDRDTDFADTQLREQLVALRKGGRHGQGSSGRD